MNNRFLVVLILSIIAITTTGSRGGRPPKERELPRTPSELLRYLPGTVWQVESNEQGRKTNIKHAKGTLIFRDKGVVEHIYIDGTAEQKHWGVTADMRLVWGGRNLRILTFSDDFASFTDSLFETTGKRMRKHGRKKEAARLRRPRRRR
jgi:hypothetical protein